MDGKHDPPPEPVVVPTILAFDGKAGGFQVFGPVAVFERLVGKGGPGIRRVAQREFFDGGVRESPLAEIRQADVAPGSGFVELFFEPSGGVFGDDVQAFAFVGRLPRFGGQFGLLDGDVVFFGNVADGFG